MKNFIFAFTLALFSFMLKFQLEAAASFKTVDQKNIATRQEAVAERSAITNVNTHTFQQILASSTKPIVLVFSAAWCKPCQSMKPILEEIAKEMPDVTFLRADFDSSPELVQSFHVESIPAILFIRPDGYVVDRTIGFSVKQQLAGRIQAFAASLKQR